jgi:hypothetical protein
MMMMMIMIIIIIIKKRKAVEDGRLVDAVPCSLIDADGLSYQKMLLPHHQHHM